MAATRKPVNNTILRAPPDWAEVLDAAARDCAASDRPGRGVPGRDGAIRWFHRCYDRLDVAAKTASFRQLLGQVGLEAAFRKDRPVALGRTPCRVRVFGGHTDFPGCGGYLINMAGNLEMICAGQGRTDRRVVLRNTHPDFGGCDFSLDDWDARPDVPIRSTEDWDRWCTWMEKKKKQMLRESLRLRTGKPISDEELSHIWREHREKNWQEFVKGIIAFLQTDLGDPTGAVRRRITGFTALYSSDIPMGWGLSSSSALVLSTAQILNTVCDLGLAEEEIIRLGYCEHYNGTRGGMNDHAVIIKGIRGKILLLRSFPEEIVESSAFAEGISLFLVDSGIKRSESPEASNKLKAEGIKDPAVILARTGIGYALASLWIRSRFAAYRDLLVCDTPGIDDGYGLLREFNHGGKIPFADRDGRHREIYRVLRAMPQYVTRRQCFAEMPEFAGELEGLFGTHPEPAAGYPLRGMALYGLSENERAAEYLERARSHDFPGMQELMRISHDGDRAVRFSFDGDGNSRETTVRHTVCDEDLDAWMKAPGRHPLWRAPGYFERSIEKVDFLCDLIQSKFGDVASARISAAGLGGSVTVLAKTAAVPEIRRFLSESGYPSIPPLVPSAGASVVSG